MKENKKLYFETIKNEKGAVLMISLLILVTLSLMGAATILTSRQEIVTSSNDRKANLAFFLAESGIERGKMILNVSQDGFNDELGLPDGILVGPNEPLGGGRYTVKVENNGDGGGATGDADYKLWLVSTGVSGSAFPAQKTTRVLIYKPPVSFPQPRGALNVLGGPNEVQGQIQGQVSINGNDTDPPIWPCSGADCNGTPVSGGDSRAGIFYNDSTNSLDITGGSSSVLGDPPSDRDPSYSAESWWDFSRSMESSADMVITDTTTISGDQQWGSANNPVVVVIDASAEARYTGTVEGAGIMIVNGPCYFSGTLNWQGLVIVTGEEGALRDVGTAHIFGGLVVAPYGNPNTENEIELQGTINVTFSQNSLDDLSDHMYQTLTTQSWRS